MTMHQGFSTVMMAAVVAVGLSGEVLAARRGGS